MSAALREAGLNDSSLAPRIWIEALEPRVMFAATAATLALDQGGIPNTFDLATGPAGILSGDPLGGASLYRRSDDSGTPSLYQGIFSTTPGATLFNPNGTDKLFDDHAA